MNLPEEFELDTYKIIHNDLHKMSDDELQTHYEKYGRLEGRRANRLVSRQDFSSLITKDMRTLEIGPFNDPVVSGANVVFADYLSQKELIARAKEVGRDYARTPSIKYVLSKSGLENINEDYDVVVSSHCIEHQPDIILHLVQVQRLIEARDGRYFLFIPDKRYCFDKHLSESTIADVINAHEDKKKTHSLKSVIEHRALTTHNDPNKHWLEGEVSTRHQIDFGKIKSAIAEWRASNNQYIDVHAWYFTPDSFAEIISLLNSLAYIDLKIERIYPTRNGSLEFWAILKTDK
jgi:hypothetical protein